MKSPTFSLERLRQVLDYDHTSGRLTWAVPGSNNRGHASVPGYVAANGRRYINIDGDVHMAHRLVWFHHHGVWPDGNIVAINGDHLDLRLDNLREETVAQTAARKSATIKSSSGTKGVNWDRRKKKWQVTITRDYKQAHYGHYSNLDEAKAVYEKAVAEYNPVVTPEERAARAVAASARAKLRRHWKNVQKAFPDKQWSTLDEFAQFVSPPEERGMLLKPMNSALPIGPGNFVWARAARFDLSTEEGKQAYKAHKGSERVYRDREKDLNKKFGLTISDYDSMLAKQGGVCACCGALENQYRAGVIRNFAVDHCHSTGVIRGLLCEQCNKGIGFFKDSIALLEKAIAYLRPFEKTETTDAVERGFAADTPSST